MQILFARHGESTANTLQVFSNRVGADFPLTARGRAQAAQLARRLASEPITHVYASPLARAMETASIVVASRSLPVRPAPAIREYDVGAFDLLPYGGEHAWRMTAYAANETAWRCGEHDRSLEGGESCRELNARVQSFLKTLVASHGPDDTILLIGHGGLWRVVLPYLLDELDAEVADRIGLDHCSVVRATVTGGRMTCVQWSDQPLPPG